MSSTVKVVLGVVIGVFAGFFLWVFAAIVFSLGVSDTGTEFLFFAAVAPAGRAGAPADLAGDAALGRRPADGDGDLLHRDVRAVRLADQQSLKETS